MKIKTYSFTYTNNYDKNSTCKKYKQTLFEFDVLKSGKETTKEY